MDLLVLIDDSCFSITSTGTIYFAGTWKSSLIVKEHAGVMGGISAVTASKLRFISLANSVTLPFVILFARPYNVLLFLLLKVISFTFFHQFDGD